MKYSKKPIPLVVTSGEPAGIGPDICLDILNVSIKYPIEILADIEILKERAKQIHKEDLLSLYLQKSDLNVSLRHVPNTGKVIAGELNVHNVPYVLNLLDTAIQGISEGIYAGMVTAPVHKGIINQYGLLFTGHTEYLQEKAAVKKVVMMLSGGGLNVALVTTHLPLRLVPEMITQDLIIEIVNIICNDFTKKFKISQPRIAIAGLNPHAGENGFLGMEEIEIIQPAIRKLKQKNISATGPYPADTIFQPEIVKNHDVILVMYHDQGLPVLKYASFGQGVNVTLGLPYVRTSVDHGTALNLAGSGKASSTSLIGAINMAIRMV